MAAGRLWRRLCQGAVFPVNYASRITPKQHFLPVSRNCALRAAGLAGSHADTQEPKANPLVSVSDEPETLYKRLSLLVKGHDRAVLDSYEYFAVLAAKELGISIEKVHNPPKKIERFTLLKSVHIYKKHRVQYEMRTHYLCLETKIEKIPEHIKEPVWDTLPQEEETEVKS
ncbi:small ribosomal subunit protein uS10m isoform X2 [Melanerpes formicivorus]|uniref:small ribosomal subunit protein uS10m isoform X2 n=1 Tax=Melanerpes formicivorus TaxID=211600 RepID=UPI00358F1735